MDFCFYYYCCCCCCYCCWFLFIFQQTIVVLALMTMIIIIINIVVVIDTVIHPSIQHWNDKTFAVCRHTYINMYNVETRRTQIDNKTHCSKTLKHNNNNNNMSNIKNCVRFWFECLLLFGCSNGFYNLCLSPSLS